MEIKKNMFRKILKALTIFIIVIYFTINIGEATFAFNNENNVNLTITINSKGKVIQEGSLFGDSLLYPSTVEDAEKGIGSISGIIKINNNYKKLNIESIGLGIRQQEIISGNNYPIQFVYNSLLDNVKINIEKGNLISFNKTLANYKSLRNMLYEEGSLSYKGLELNSKINISKGETIYLKYTLQMIPEAGNELQSITANIPIYINMNTINTKNNEYDYIQNNKDEVVINTDNKYIDIKNESIVQSSTHNCITTLLDNNVITGFPHETLKIDDYKMGTVDNQIFIQEVVQPERYISRAEIAALLNRALGLEGNNDITAIYIDPIPNWARTDIGNTTNNNIFIGYPGSMFNATKNITIEEIIEVLKRALENQLNNNKCSLNLTNEEEINTWILETINNAGEENIIEQYLQNTSTNKNNITRNQTFNIICKLMGLHE